MANSDDQNPYRHAPKGESVQGRQKRLTNYYSFQRKQAEALSDQGNQAASKEASQIYSKLAKGNDKRAVDAPYFDSRQEEDQSKAQQYGVRAQAPGQMGRIMGDAVQAGQLGAKAMGQGPGLAEAIQGAAPIIRRVVGAVSDAINASKMASKGAEGPPQALSGGKDPNWRFGQQSRPPMGPVPRNPQPGSARIVKEGKFRPSSESGPTMEAGGRTQAKLGSGKKPLAQRAKPAETKKSQDKVRGPIARPGQVQKSLSGGKDAPKKTIQRRAAQIAKDTAPSRSKQSSAKNQSDSTKKPATARKSTAASPRPTPKPGAAPKPPRKKKSS